MRAAQRIPQIKIPRQAKSIVDLCDDSEDWIPIYDKSTLSGFYMAVGSSGNQFKNEPVVGEMTAELIVACENDHDRDQDPVQFKLEHQGRSVSMGFYSQLGEVNADSSFSVLG